MDAFSRSRSPTWPTVKMNEKWRPEATQKGVPSLEQTTFTEGPSSRSMMCLAVASCFPSLSRGEYTPETTICGGISKQP